MSMFDATSLFHFRLSLPNGTIDDVDYAYLLTSKS